jgi:hypothetical protein
VGCLPEVILRINDRHQQNEFYKSRTEVAKRYIDFGEQLTTFDVGVKPARDEERVR